MFIVLERITASPLISPLKTVLCAILCLLALISCSSSNNTPSNSYSSANSSSSVATSVSSSSSIAASSSTAASSSSVASSSSSAVSSAEISSSSISSSSSAPDLTFYNNQADGIVGGQLYSKFWATETGFTLNNSNLTDQNELDAIDANADFFRCKHCHGWDRLGQDGGYANRAPSTTRPQVANLDLALFADLSTPSTLFTAIKRSTARRDISEDLSSYDPVTNATTGNQMPNFAQILTDEQIWHIVKYLKDEAVDTSELYTLTLGSGSYPNRTVTFSELGKDGNATNGDAIFASTCASCHGADGTLIMVDGGAYTVGGHVRSKPYEDQHKVKFGHLGSIMIPSQGQPLLSQSPLSDFKDLFKALADTTKYPTDQPVALDGAQLYANNCSGCHGPLASSTKTGRTFAQIKDAIANQPLMASISLTDDEIQAIADAL